MTDKLAKKSKSTKEYQTKGSNFFHFLIRFSTFLTFASLILIIAYIIAQGISHIRLDMFDWTYTSENLSMMPAIITTVIIVGLSILISAPIGVFTGFYLVEYAKRGSKLVEVIRLSAETLAAIPSIVYGLFGMLFFVTRLDLGYSIISGVLTVTIMILPLIIRATEEALLTVDDSLRQGSFGLGAGKLRTIFRVVLPSAMPGIIAGIILAIGRVVGETAALMYTLGTTANMPKNLWSSGRTLALHMYVLSSEGLHVQEAYATGVILLVVVIILNHISESLSKKVTKRGVKE